MSIEKAPPDVFFEYGFKKPLRAQQLYRVGFLHGLVTCYICRLTLTPQKIDRIIIQ
jgi:hypothetical protein